MWLLDGEEYRPLWETLIVNSLDRLHANWHHLCATYDGSSTAAGMKVYFDGRLADSLAMNPRVKNSIRNDRPFRVGGFNGCIDDLRIYDRQLAAEEVVALYEYGRRTVARIDAKERGAEHQSLLRPSRRGAPIRPLNPLPDTVEARLRQVEG